tara:strand:+ start:103 stop:462 length:360 start_codon:yes stop_codon:yes gene_type:complete
MVEVLRLQATLVPTTDHPGAAPSSSQGLQSGGGGSRKRFHLGSAATAAATAAIANAQAAADAQLEESLRKLQQEKAAQQAGTAAKAEALAKLTSANAARAARSQDVPALVASDLAIRGS